MKALHGSSETRLAWQNQGSGRPIVLVHGWGVSGALFDEQVRGLAGRYRLIVPDLPGHGASLPFPPDAPFALLADRLAGLLRELNLRDFCLVGWSLGALVAWDLLARHRDLAVAGLMTVDMVPKILNGPDWWFGLREGQDAGAFGRHVEHMLSDWQAYTGRFVPRIFSQLTCAQNPGLVERTREIASRNPPAGMAAIWQRMVEQDFRGVLPALRLPCRVVAGVQSQLYGVAAARWITAQIPGARSVLFARSGHAPHLEEPEAFNALLARFADSPGAQPDELTTVPAEAGH